MQEALRPLKELRLLHLRLSDTDELKLFEGYSGKDVHHVAFLLQRFSDRLFGDISKEREGVLGAPKLDALVLGHALPVERRRGNTCPLQQRCFVRGEQRDSLGRTITVGVPVTRAALQNSHPYTDILGVDP